MDENNQVMEDQNTPKPITQSILLTIKKMLGIAEEYHAFDIDIVVNINAVFLTLNQLAIGPNNPFAISDDSQVWSDFLDNQEDILQGVQTYVYQRVRLMFDPPTNSFLVDSMKKQIEEFEWRFNVQAEYYKPHHNVEPEESTNDISEAPVTHQLFTSVRKEKIKQSITPIDIFGH